MTEYEKILRDACIRPIRSIDMQFSRMPFIRVTYDHGIVTHKMDIHLQKFLYIQQHLQSRRMMDADSSLIEECIACPLHYYGLLGFQKGDIARFENDGREQLLIQFS